MRNFVMQNYEFFIICEQKCLKKLVAAAAEENHHIVDECGKGAEGCYNVGVGCLAQCVLSMAVGGGIGDS